MTEEDINVEVGGEQGFFSGFCIFQLFCKLYRCD